MKWNHLYNNEYECSECGGRVYGDEFFKEPLYSYCPYCGRKLNDEERFLNKLKEEEQ